MTDYKAYTPEQYPNIPPAISETAYADFRGAFPDVPVAPDVDVAELTAGDGEPFFITLPIAEVGMVSANKLRYTEDFCDSLVEQINSDKPTGIRGHIKDDERRYAYPMPAIYWVGAIRETDGKVWAKGYIPPGATREEYRIKKATAAAAATSIYGKPLMIREHTDGSYTPVLSLEQVDLAPPKRAAHGKGYGFAVTREMDESEGDDPMTKTIKEMTAEEVMAAVEPSVVQQIVEMQRPSADPVIAEMEQTVTAQKATIAELEGRVSVQAADLAELRGRLVEGELDKAIHSATDWNVKTADGSAKLDFLRGLLKKAAIAELGDETGTAAVQGAVDKAMTGNQVIVEMTRDNLAGPQALAGAQDNRAGADARRLTPDEIISARGRVGF